MERMVMRVRGESTANYTRGACAPQINLLTRRGRSLTRNSRFALLYVTSHPFSFSVSCARLHLMVLTQHSLVKRLQNGPADSDWNRFYRLYEKPILAVAASRSLSPADCEDVLQETMTKMFQHGFARYDPSKGRFTPFLFGIAKDCAIDALRRRARKESREIAIGESKSQSQMKWGPSPVDKKPTPATNAELQGQLALIGTILDFVLAKGTFAPKTVDIFKALAFEEKSPEEVARIFRTTRGNVDQAKSAVLKKLRPMCEALDEGLDLEQALARATQR